MQTELDFVHRRTEDSDDCLDGRAALFPAGQLRHHHGRLFIEAKQRGDLRFDFIAALGGARAAGRKKIHTSCLLYENELSFSIMSSVSLEPEPTAAVSTKRPMLGQISVCNGCCCGQTHKGHPEVPVEWLKQEWKYRGLLKRVHLTISGCLGPCDVPNVVLITSTEGTQWLAQISQRRQYEMLADWAEQSKIADRLLPLPREFNNHRLAAYRDDEKGYK